MQGFVAANGQLIEISTLNHQGIVDGTALFRVDQAYQADVHGLFLGCSYCGASSAARAAELEFVFGGQEKPLLHLCCSHRLACPAVVGQRRILHSDLFRSRHPQLVVEPWVKHSAALGVPTSVGNGAASALASAGGPGREADKERLQQKIADLKKVIEKQRNGAAGGLYAAAQERGKRKRTDSEVEDNDGDGPLFPQASSHSCAANGIQVMARKAPGALFMKGVAEITKYLGERDGPTIRARSSMRACWPT